MFHHRLVLLAAACASLTASAGMAQAQARPSNCQVVESETGQGRVRQTLCQGADGVWRPQETPPAAPSADLGGGLSVGGGAFPPGWSGRVTYRGTYQGAIETPGPRMRRFSVDEALRSATGGRREEIGGPYSLELNIDGNAVSGRLTTSGGLRNAAVSGTRNGDRCRLFIGDVSIEAECTASRFDGRARTQGDARRIYSYRIDTEAIQLVDNRAEAARRETAAAEAEARRAEQRAERERAAEAEAARIAALPRASQAQANLLERAVRQDSSAWILNRYDVGSMSNVRVSSNTGGVTTLRGEYTYNGGSRGWVEARLASGRVECLGYWDTGGCTAVRTPARSGGASGGGVPGTTVRIDSLNWHTGYASEDRTYWTGFAHVRDMGGGVMRIYSLSMFNDSDEPYLMLVEVDCRQNRSRAIEGRRYIGEETQLFLINDEAVTHAEGTVGWSLYQTVCNRDRWRRINDPVRAAYDWVRS